MTDVADTLFHRFAIPLYFFSKLHFESFDHWGKNTNQKTSIFF